MAVRFSLTGLVVDDRTPPPFLPAFLDCVLRGVGQVMLQNNSYAGLLFLIGIFHNSPLFALAVLVGTTVSTATAMLLVAWGMGAAEPAIRSGAFGFNSALVAIALGGVFFVLGAASIVYALLATIAAAVVFAAVSAALEPLGMPALTFPFVLVVWLFLLASLYFPRLRAVAAG